MVLMRDSAFRLQDKTILLRGPFGGVTQALLRTLTELGADVAYVDAHQANANRYCEGLNEAREVHPTFGRAIYFPAALQSDAEIKDILGRVAQGVGRMDALVEVAPLSWATTTDVSRALQFSVTLAQALLPYFAVRQRGRIIYVFEDSALTALAAPGFVSTYQGPLMQHIGEWARAWRLQAVTVNGLALGVTEDFVLRHFAKNGSIKKTLSELESQTPGVKLLEGSDIATALAFLVSSASGSVTGQVLRLTHGL